LVHDQRRLEVDALAAGEDGDFLSLEALRLAGRAQAWSAEDAGSSAVAVAVATAGDSSGAETVGEFVLYPAQHHTTTADELESIVESIRAECAARVAHFRAEGQHVEAQRLDHRVSQDVARLIADGFCPGLENYSAHLARPRRAPGSPPPTLLDSMPTGWLLVVDESHITVPQIGSMHAGDRARKQSLVEHGFRLPSALDNRPLTGTEFWRKVDQAVFVSATPGKEITVGPDMSAAPAIADLVVRPSGPLAFWIPSSKSSTRRPPAATRTTN